MGPWQTWTERLRRAFLDFDRRLGGTQPPPKPQLFVARHPVGTGLSFGSFFGLLLAFVLSAFDDPVRLLQAALMGVGAGLFTWLFCRVERRRQAHYNREGGFGRAGFRPPPDVDDLPPVRYAGLHWVGLWTVCLVVVQLAGQAQNPPFTWTRSAIYAGIIVVAGWAARLVKERRSGR